jgi:hypothetical protein
MAALEFWVPGIARTKGSVDTGRHGQVLHTRASKDRAALIVEEAEKAVVAYGWRRIDPPLGVEVVHVAWLPCADGAMLATQANVGDIDKIDRNLLDALTTAGVWADDVQVVSLHSHKHVAGEHPVGEYIAVRTVPAMAAVTRRERDAVLAHQAIVRVVGAQPVPRGF